MSVNNQLVLSYLNNAVTEAEIENAKKYNLDLTIIKLEIKEKEPQKFKDILKFVNTYFDFPSIVHDSNYSYLIFLRNIRLHTAVLMIKNLNLALKLNFSYNLKYVAVTNFDKEDNPVSVIGRLNKYVMKAKLSGTEIFYGTKQLDFNEKNKLVLNEIFEKNKTVFIYGIYQEAPIKIDAEVVKLEENHSHFKVQKEFLSFLQKQPIVYFQHQDIPDVFSATILDCNYEKGTLEVGEFKFIDHSPIHRKNLRVAPITPVKASLGFEEFVINGFISDISATSVLFTTELNNIDELQNQSLMNKTFNILFYLNIYNNSFNVNVKATIFKTKGNQLILNIFADPDTQKIINEYVNMCYQQLLLQLQGKVV